MSRRFAARVTVALALVGGAGPATAQAPRVVYLNFSDGTETLNRVPVDDAPSNGSAVGSASPYPAFRWPAVTTGTATRAEVVGRIGRRVHEVFLPYNVLVTLGRPPAGPYTMVMIGGRPRDVGVDLDVAGLAYLDCPDAQPSNLVFAFAEAVRGSEQGLVSTIAQEAAHAFGLEHTAVPQDLMHPMADPRQMRFLDEEMALLGDRSCGPTTQNSHRRLLGAVGAWVGAAKPFDDGTRPDRTAPELSVVDPAVDDRPLAQPFRVRVQASDEGGIDQVLLVAGAERSARQRPPYEWSLGGYPAGPLTLTVVALDRAGNVQQVERQLRLAADPGLPGGCALSGPAVGRSAAAGHQKRGPTLVPLVALVLGALAALRRARRSLINPSPDVQPSGQPSG